MKKLLNPIAISALFAAFLTLTSCQKDELQPPPAEAPEVPEVQIVGKWTMDAAIADHIDYGINQIDTTRFTTEDYFDFKADSTVLIMAANVAYDGNWSMVGDKIVFTNTDYVDFPGGFDVVSLTESDLKLNHIQNNPPDHYLEAKLNFTR